jgi:hypothetical protein
LPADAQLDVLAVAGGGGSNDTGLLIQLGRQSSPAVTTQPPSRERS